MMDLTNSPAHEHWVSLSRPGNSPAASVLAPIRKRGRQEEPEHRSVRPKTTAGPMTATGWHQEGVDIELQKNLELLS